ncbi:MAG: peptide ABC transporter substrate-binding protein, partial [Oscillospiraceae bacterium]|nr:peptide ABC transporter substrate-binding protein [Oscillospiraceae bacterium]
TQLLEEIAQDKTVSEKVSLCGEAEKIMLQDHYFIPLFYQNLYFIHTAENTDLYSRPFTHSIDFRKAKHFH